MRRTKTRKRYRIVCENCKGEFVKENNTKTCSFSCRDQLRTKRRLEYSNVAECPFCQEIRHLVFKVRDIKVCSEKCKNGMFGRYYRSDHPEKWEEYKSHPKNIVPEVSKCEYCKNEYHPKRYLQKYCSKNCKVRGGYYLTEKRQRRIKKLDFIREEQDRSIGSCSLCHISYDKILTPLSLGMKTTYGNGKSKFHKDHLIPQSQGGTETRYICWFCNMTRKDLSVKYDPAIAEAGKSFWLVINSI